MKLSYILSALAWRRSGVVIAVATSLFLSGAVSVRAFVFALGEVNGSFDTTLSVGILNRLQIRLMTICG